jgi:serine/threonine-protein kinase
LLTCPTCHQHFGGEEHFCPRDGSPLTPDKDTPSSDPLIGRVLSGRYRLAERLGQGGMGTVYRAVHTLMDKPVAVKVLRGELSSDAEAVARFHREARSASKLDHDHCIRVTDFGQSDDGLLFLVMELLDGTSLGQVVRRGPVPAARAAAIARAIAEALDHAHEHGIIHRDLKPDNVFLARRPRGRELVKVLDFGLAKLVHDGSLNPAASITRDGTVFGTPEYMAPEQAEGEKLDGRTDLYALGVILYQLVCGDVPFRATNFVALLTKQVGEKPVPPRERRPDLPIVEGLEAVILKCLAKRPDDRFASAQALAEALEPFASSDSSQLMLLPARGLPSGEHATVSPTGAQDRPSQKLRAPSGEHAIIPETPSRLATTRGEITGGETPSAVLFTKPRRRRRLALGITSAVVIAGAAVALAVVHRPADAPPKIESPGKPDIVETPLERAERLMGSGDLDGAEAVLKNARADGDSAPLQEALAACAEKRGNRLGALAHLERAARLSPKDAEPRSRLAALLFRLGHSSEACKTARVAIQLDPEGPRAGAARAVISQARCKEASP